LNILGLSIGISGLIFAILYWNDEHAYNTWNPEKEHVYQVINKMGDDLGYWYTNVAPLGPMLKETTPDLESYCYANTWYFNEIVTYKGKKEFVKILDSQDRFFKYFPFDFMLGTAASAISDESSIALSETTAHRLFGDENPLNMQVQYSGRTLVVRGVYKIQEKSAFAPEAVTNLIGNDLKQNQDSWGNFNKGLWLKINDPSKVPVIEKAISDLYFEHRIKPSAKEEGISPEEYVEKYGSITPILEPLATARLHSVTDGYPEGKGNYQFLIIMVSLSVLILLLSIVNYINLATANAIKRAKEVGVRKIVGATKINIVWQFIFETVIISWFSILLALVLVEITLPYYNEFLGKELIIYGSQFYLQILLILLVVIALAGIFPAIYVSNFETLKVLRGNFGRSKSGIWLRNGMLVLQFAIASFFIVGSYIVYQQVQYMANKDLGFRGSQILEINLRRVGDVGIFNRYETIKQEIKKIKGVVQVSTGAFSFGEGARSSSSFQYHDIGIQGQNMAIDFGMLEMMNIDIMEGRDISMKFASDTINAMLVNETAAKLMNEPDLIGKEVDWNDHALNIIGVVKDFNLFGLQEDVPPMAFFHFKTIDWMEYNLDKVFVKVSTQNMDETIGQIEKLWTAKVNTEYPFAYDFVDKKFARTYEEYIKQKNLFSLLNIIVILISLFGLFALASYSIERRMKGIAIRKTLGADTNRLLKELSKQYVVFCVIGFVMALFPAYFLLNTWLENFAFRISISFIPFMIGFVVLLVLTLAVVLSRAYQATRVDVLKYLKYE